MNRIINTAMYNIIITFHLRNNQMSNVNRTQSSIHESRVHLQRRRPTANENDASG